MALQGPTLGKNVIDFFTNEDFDSFNTYQSEQHLMLLVIIMLFM